VRQFFLLFNHVITPSQEEDAKTNWHIGKFVPLPAMLKQQWATIDPFVDEIDGQLGVFKEFLQTHGSSDDVVLIQGDFGAVYKMVNFAKSIGMVPVYATTKREVKEEQADGKLKKTSYFQHIQFRKF
jgi:hypothetical protein